ncbi:MAG: metallophosphoesterase, partial [Byssovorax sp.]
MQRSGLSFVLFFAVITLVVGGTHYYLWSRLIRAPELGPVWQRRGAFAFTGLALLIPLGFMARSILPRPVASVVSWASYGWLGVTVLFLFLLLGSELVRLVIRGYNAVSSAPADPDRRLAISRGIAGVVAFVGLGAAVTGTASALGQVALRNVTVPLRKLSPALSGFRIAQLTDV